MDISLADITITINHAPEAVEQIFKDFLCDFLSADIRFDIMSTRYPIQAAGNRHQVLAAGRKSIFYEDGLIHIVDDDMRYPVEITSAEDWSSGVILFTGKQGAEGDFLLTDRISKAVKTIFVNALSYRKGILVHSAAINWNGKGIVFAAPSGTGKSTHVSLWQERYGVPVINGDSAACRIIGHVPVVYGLPWCGSSGQYLNASLPLGAVVFLEQADKNTIIRLDTAEAVVRLYARCFQFTLDENMMDQVLSTINDMVAKTACYLLKCRPDFEAVELVKKCLE